jgi:hypothetical protein
MMLHFFRTYVVDIDMKKIAQKFPERMADRYHQSQRIAIVRVGGRE